MPQPEPFKLGIVAKMNNDGLLLTTIEKGSHSDNAGLKVGDVILGADRRYAKSLSASERKQFIEGLHVWRRGATLNRCVNALIPLNFRVSVDPMPAWID